MWIGDRTPPTLALWMMIRGTFAVPLSSMFRWLSLWLRNWSFCLGFFLLFFLNYGRFFSPLFFLLGLRFFFFPGVLCTLLLSVLSLSLAAGCSGWWLLISGGSAAFPPPSFSPRAASAPLPLGVFLFWENSFLLQEADQQQLLSSPLGCRPFLSWLRQILYSLPQLPSSQVADTWEWC